MTTEQRDKMIRTCNKNDIAFKTYDGYSGRFMYGRTTQALTVESVIDMGFLVKKAEKKGIDLRTDQLGLGFIVY